MNCCCPLRSRIAGSWRPCSAAKRAPKCAFWVAPGGDRARLLAAAADNARDALRRRRQAPDPGAALLDLQTRLHLPNLPARLECLDISTLQGGQSVGALTAFTDGVPDKSRYRRFKIREVAGQDDYAMLREVVMRHYGKAGRELPDLLVVDGGRGQLNVVLASPQGTGPDEHPGGGPGQGHGAGRPRQSATASFCRGAKIPSCPRPTPRAGSSSSGSGTKPTASPSPTTASGPAKNCWPRPYNKPRASARSQAPPIVDAFPQPGRHQGRHAWKKSPPCRGLTKRWRRT